MPPKNSSKSAAANRSKKRASPTDDDTAPRASKRVKSKAKVDEEEEDSTPFIPKLQKDDEGNDYVALKENDLRRITINEFKGRTLVHIREYYKKADSDKALPGKGISLTLDQYNAFVTALPLLESVLSKRGEKVARPDFDGGAATPAAEENNEEDEETEEKDDDEQGSDRDEKVVKRSDSDDEE